MPTVNGPREKRPGDCKPRPAIHLGPTPCAPRAAGPGPTMPPGNIGEAIGQHQRATQEAAVWAVVGAGGGAGGGGAAADPGNSRRLYAGGRSGPACRRPLLRTANCPARWPRLPPRFDSRCERHG